MIARRSFLTGAASLLAVPAAVRVGSPVEAPRPLTITVPPELLEAQRKINFLRIRLPAGYTIVADGTGTVTAGPPIEIGKPLTDEARAKITAAYLAI